MTQVRYDTKLEIFVVGFLMSLVSGVVLITNCSVFRWALQPCEGSQVYSFAENIFTITGVIGVVMMILSWLLPSKPIRDDYNSALGQYK